MDGWDDFWPQAQETPCVETEIRPSLTSRRLKAYPRAWMVRVGCGRTGGRRLERREGSLQLAPRLPDAGRERKDQCLPTPLTGQE